MFSPEAAEENKGKLIRKITTDVVIVEQPLQITLSWLEQGVVKNTVFTITMRTPGHDKLLITGLLHSEGVIKQLSDIESIKLASEGVTGEGWQNEWLVHFITGFTPDLSSLERYIISYSSCGLCGSTSLKTLQLKTTINLAFTEHKHALAAQSLLLLSSKMRSEQALFDKTGGVHGAALFMLKVELAFKNKVERAFEQQLNKQLTLQHIYEDIGRHNAVDKVIGALLTSTSISSTAKDKLAQVNCDALSLSVPLRLLLVSGRISFEIVQKTIMAGIHVLVGVGAPSDLAIQAAKQFDLTLIGFVSERGFNVYHGDWRLSNHQR
ncbi:MAG: formate dehydrogenase accessory sulfurtransferase FdhD [Colwellia sp.]|uniref:formate dehydrogenase accessory sulfurtransferase FdhD n=1 Tax=Colwellia sp. TaxID=56799 RepID=UPI001D9C0DB9|nr:formate dehydrogenase accessory sulfurtransferase FdhD [Colwellia sp.]NQY50112.1 formate dehydrogenase accessory sulfurtransferase FdhD [Colwellia sp.]